MDLFFESKTENGLSPEQIRSALRQSLEGAHYRNVLIIPPDFTRYHSNAGYITSVYYHLLTECGCNVEILPALGTHEPLTKQEAETMFPGIPFERFVVHNWRSDTIYLGSIPADYLCEITDGLWREPIQAEINQRVMDERYDLILSVGQVVPHEVIGMANHAKNLFVGVGGSDMINKSHMVGAVYGMERMMGRDHTPVRKIFDYGMEHFLSRRPITFVLTVCTACGDQIRTHGLYIGQTRKTLERAIALSQIKNIEPVSGGLKKCVVYLDPAEFKSTWLGNKAIYRTRMAIADEGELIILAPGITRFGEDLQVDKLIRKYGYRGRIHTLDQFNRTENQDLRDNMGAAAHLIHGSPNGRFKVTYAVKNISPQEITDVGYAAEKYDAMIKQYDPQRLNYGYQTLGGEEIYYIPNPALGLWINKEMLQ